MARRQGEQAIRGLGDLAGRVLGCGNDPSLLELLAAKGLRWPANARLPDGRQQLVNLLVFTDQRRIHDALVEGVVDAFVVERPIYHWAANHAQSPWFGQVEILSPPIDEQPCTYSVGVAARPENVTLLAVINAFLAEFRGSARHREIERTWQGELVEARPWREGTAGIVDLAMLTARRRLAARDNCLGTPGQGRCGGGSLSLGPGAGQRQDPFIKISVAVRYPRISPCLEQ